MIKNNTNKNLKKIQQGYYTHLLRSIKRLSKSTIIILFCVAGFSLAIVMAPLPDPLFNPTYSTVLSAQDATLLSATIADDEQWRFPESDSIPGKFKTALVLFEDEYFEYHPGVNPVSLIRAIHQNLEAGKVVSGGSTLSMQTVRLALGNQNRTYWQKMVEILASIKLEFLYSKDEILKKYSDHAPFGGNIVGISAASWRYYGRPVHLLSWAEAATLAILPNSPSSIFPGKNQQELLSKRNRLLDKLHDRGYVNESELYMAKEEPLPDRWIPIPNDAYHLIHRAMNEGGKGTLVSTTLNPTLQRNASKMVNDFSGYLSEMQINNAAAIILDIETGHTLAYVGNSDNKGNHGQFVDIITSKRSPGSLLKPLLYALALDYGLITPTQLLPDIPVFYRGFSPKNFDKEYRGAVPADQALVSSLNVPFVHLLIEYGYERFHQDLKEMGMVSLDRPAGHYGLSIILGGSETTLWEITSIYAGLARMQQHFDMQSKSKFGFFPNTYLEKGASQGQVTGNGEVKPESVQFTLDAMKQLHRPYEEAGWERFNSSRKIAWKTGTSFGFRDGWAIGMDGKYLVGVWIGNADGEGRPGLTGVGVAAPLMFKLFTLVEGDQSWKEHSFGEKSQLCIASGMLASKICPDVSEVFLPSYMHRTPVCNFHRPVHLNKEGTHQVNNSCYQVSQMREEPWFVLPPVQEWYFRKNNPHYKTLPPFAVSCNPDTDQKSMDLIYPNQFTRVKIPLEQDGKKGMSIFEAVHQDKSAVIYWHIDEEYLGFTQGKHQKGISVATGDHVLTLVDSKGNEIIRRFEVIE